jgi:hypothetical protein
MSVDVRMDDRVSRGIDDECLVEGLRLMHVNVSPLASTNHSKHPHDQTPHLQNHIIRPSHTDLHHFASPSHAHHSFLNTLNINHLNTYESAPITTTIDAHPHTLIINSTSSPPHSPPTHFHQQCTTSSIHLSPQHALICPS